MERVRSISQLRRIISSIPVGDYVDLYYESPGGRKWGECAVFHNEDGSYSVVDNGEGVDCTSLASAIRIAAEDLNLPLRERRSCSAQ